MESTLRNQIRKFFLIHLQEDNKYYSKLQKVVDQETNGKLHGRNIQKYLITLRDKLGIKPQKFLGRGWYGFAFLSTDNKTIKITSDRSEAI